MASVLHYHEGCRIARRLQPSSEFLRLRWRDDCVADPMEDQEWRVIGLNVRDRACLRENAVVLPGRDAKDLLHDGRRVRTPTTRRQAAGPNMSTTAWTELDS